jgi:hypothetical protein
MDQLVSVEFFRCHGLTPTYLEELTNVSAAAMSFQSLPIDDSEMPRVEESNYLLGSQRGQRSTHSLSKGLISNIASSHRVNYSAGAHFLGPAGVASLPSYHAPIIVRCP